MLDSLFSTDASTATTVELGALLGSIAAALVLGLVIAFVYCFKSRHTKSFVTTLALLPAIVCIVIAVVNGNVGAGVAVVGTFSLVRFRSVAGTARDICFIFLSMAVGLTCGMGYVGYAAIFTAIMSVVIIAYQVLGVGGSALSDRTLRVTVPEDLDYNEIFDDILDRYTNYHELDTVKTTNMGSLYKLTYKVGLKDAKNTKALIDELRTRNGNLEIALTHQEASNDEL